MVGFAVLVPNGNLFAGYFKSDGLRHTHNDLFQSETETASKGVANDIYRMRHVSVYKSSILHVYLPAKKLKQMKKKKVKAAHFGGLII